MPLWRRTAASRGGAFARTLLADRIRTGVAIRMSDPEDVMVRGVMAVVVVAVLVALPWAQPPSGGRRSRNAIGRKTSGRERQVIRDPSTGARLTGSLLSAAGAR